MQVFPSKQTSTTESEPCAWLIGFPNHLQKLNSRSCKVLLTKQPCFWNFGEGLFPCLKSFAEWMIRVELSPPVAIVNPSGIPMAHGSHLNIFWCATALWISAMASAENAWKNIFQKPFATKQNPKQQTSFSKHHYFKQVGTSKKVFTNSIPPRSPWLAKSDGASLHSCTGLDQAAWNVKSSTIQNKHTPTPPRRREDSDKTDSGIKD